MSAFSGVIVEVLLLESKEEARKKDNAIDLKVTDTYTHIHIQPHKLVVSKEEGVGRGMDWECGINRCNLLHIEWMKNKVVLYSTGNYIHCPGINHSGKEYEEEVIYLSIHTCTQTHITESLCCTAESNTTL